jgi:DNA-binding CsgD family transcriptional regulator
MELAQRGTDPRTVVRAAGLTAELEAFADPTRLPRLVNNLADARAGGDLWWLSEGLCNLAAAQFTGGDTAGARATIDEALAVADTSGDAFERRQALCFKGFLAAMAGDLTTAIDVVVPHIDVARATHDTSTLPLALAALAIASAYGGDAETARDAAHEAVEVSEEAGSPWSPTAFAARAFVAFGDGDLETLAAMVGEFRRVSIEFGMPVDNLVPWLALAQALSGDVGRAAQTLDDMTATTAAFVEAGRHQAQAVIARARGELGRAEDAAHRALAAARTGLARTSEVECVELLAGLAADLGSPEEAARLLGASSARRQAAGFVTPAILQPAHDADVCAIVDAIGVERYDALTTEGAAMTWTQALDYATRGRGDRKRPSSGWESLTPTELAVVKLVTEGLSNQQVAERLFVTRRTVGTHLTHIFAKLGFTNRSELVATAVRRGL